MRRSIQISSRFTIAVHVLVCIETFKNDYKETSDFLASSVNVNPVMIRRLLQIFLDFYLWLSIIKISLVVLEKQGRKEDGEQRYKEVS